MPIPALPSSVTAVPCSVMPVRHQGSQTQSSQAGGGWEDITGDGRSLEIQLWRQEKISAGQKGDEEREAVCAA